MCILFKVLDSSVLSVHAHIFRFPSERVVPIHLFFGIAAKNFHLATEVAAV